MKITRISSFAHQLTRFGLFNAYLVRELDGFTLIDTGLPGSAKAILSAARHLRGGHIRRILLTHAHGDHIGSLDALARHFTHATSTASNAAATPPKEVAPPIAHTTTPDIAISHRESRLLPKKPAQDRSLDPGEPQCKLKGGFPGAATPATHLLIAGELYGSLRVLATPGHTPGHFSFLDERDGTLYAGDALVTVGGKPHVAGFGPWYFPLPRLATWHRPTALASIQNLLTLSDTIAIEHIAPGHGRVLEGGRDLLESAIKRAV